jgi:Na+-translocating ferredoxin:NAD+ oxidoreductase RnfG subunit
MNKMTMTVFAAAVTLFAVISKPAQTVEYLTLKDAVKHFISADAKLSKVEKTIPKDKLDALKKQFDLEKSADFNDKISEGPYTFYVGRDAAGNASAYVLILDQYWRTCYHKYVVGITPDGKIKEIIVMELNCKYEYAINKKSFLNQFQGKNAPPKIGKDVDAVTGATASSEATAIVARRALALYNVFFGLGSK